MGLSLAPKQGSCFSRCCIYSTLRHISGSVFWPPHVYCSASPLACASWFLFDFATTTLVKIRKGTYTIFQPHLSGKFTHIANAFFFYCNYIRAIAYTSFAIFYVLRKALHVARSIRLLCRFCDGFGRKHSQYAKTILMKPLRSS